MNAMLHDSEDLLKCTIENPNKIFGISLGTSYCCIAYVNEFGIPKVINNEDFSSVTPSAVAFNEDGSVFVGNDALYRLKSNPENVCLGIKKYLGYRDYGFNAFGKDYSPEDICSMILGKLVKDASLHFKNNVKDVVVTYPAYYGSNEKMAIKNVCESVGLNLVSAVNEPTAAVLGSGANYNDNETVLVYDLGGYSFDVTIFRIDNNNIIPLATGGDHTIGGRDWDDVIRNYVINTYCEQTGESPESIYDDIETLGYLELRAETVKKQLSKNEKAVIRIHGKAIDISRKVFEQLSCDMLDYTIKVTRETINEALKKGVIGIDRIILVGGGTYMPQVQERIARAFPDVIIEKAKKPDQVIAKGAAMVANEMSSHVNDDIGMKEEKEVIENKEQFIHYDFLHLSDNIAIKKESPDGKVHIVNIIFRGSYLPVYAKLSYKLKKDQIMIPLEVYKNQSMVFDVPINKCEQLFKKEIGPLPNNIPEGTTIDLLLCVYSIDKITIDVTKSLQHTEYISEELKEMQRQSELLRHLKIN